MPGTGSCQEPTFIQTFASNADGWFAVHPTDNTWFPPETEGLLTVVGGEGRLAPIILDTTLNAITPMGGYSTVFPPAGYRTILDVYLDPDNQLPDDPYFAYNVTINDSSDCAHKRGEAFLGGWVGAQYCARLGRGTHPCGGTHEVVTVAGWYRYLVNYTIDGGDVVVNQTVTGPDGFELSVPQAVVGPVGEVGGNRIGWFDRNGIDGLRIRNSARANN